MTKKCAEITSPYELSKAKVNFNLGPKFSLLNRTYLFIFFTLKSLFYPAYKMDLERKIRKTNKKPDQSHLKHPPCAPQTQKHSMAFTPSPITQQRHLHLPYYPHSKIQISSHHYIEATLHSLGCLPAKKNKQIAEQCMQNWHNWDSIENQRENKLT